MEHLHEAVWFILVGLVWGATNPFIKRNSAGIKDVAHPNRVVKFLLELKFLALNWKYMVPFTINQLGAVLYYATIGKADITLAVPITNSLALIFTALFGKLLGENISKWTVGGGALVMSGVALCVMSKVS